MLAQSYQGIQYDSSGCTGYEYEIMFNNFNIFNLL